MCNILLINYASVEKGGFMANLPKWAEFIRDRYKSAVANTFILTGNIGDYVAGNMYMKDYLVQEFLCNEDMRMENIYYYDIYNNGICIKGREKSSNTLNWERFISKINDSTSRNAFLIYYPQFLLPPGNYLQPNEQERVVSLHSVLNSSSYISSQNIVIIVSDSLSEIHPLFLGSNSKVSVFNIELPDIDDRLMFIKAKMKESGYEAIISYEQMANLTAGLQLTSIEDIILMGRGKKVDSSMVMERKKEVIKKEFGEVIEIFETEGYSLKDFAGQENIKTYFREVVIDSIKTGDVEIMPKGIMLMGPPGTGKTFFARCLAGDAGINFVEFKLSKILGKYVGESEKSMEKALSVFRALAPVGVFMDEIDQSMQRGEGGSDGASSVNANIFGMLLAEMSKPENRGKILWLAATNYPNNVDEALKRAGRFDKKIPFFAPTQEEREYVFQLHLNKAKKQGISLDANIDVVELASKTEKYTQAEIEGIIVKALELCKRKRMSVLNQETVLLALEYMISAQNAKITEMEDIALKECNDQEFIPTSFKERHRKLMSGSMEEFGEVNRANLSR